MRPSIEKTLEAARGLLEDVELISDASFSQRSRVLRVRTGSTTAIVKNHEKQSARFVERAVLAALPNEVSPQLLDASSEVLVIEDLGDGSSVADRLRGNDPQAATNALAQWARSLGTIAAVTSGLDNQRRIPRMALDIDASGLDVVAESWNVPISSRMRTEVDESFALSNDPTAASSHSVAVGDAACADNNRIVEGKVKLFDFEWSGWANTAIDASYCLTPFSTCWCVARLPPEIQEATYDAYCEKFSQGRSDAFRREVALTGLVTTLPGLTRSSLEVSANPPWKGGPNYSTLSARQHFRLRIEWLAGLTDALPATSHWAASIHDAFAERYPDTLVPVFPAYETDG